MNLKKRREREEGEKYLMHLRDNPRSEKKEEEEYFYDKKMFFSSSGGKKKKNI